MACFNGNDGPPRSRTVVKPRIRVRSAWALAASKMKPMSAVSSAVTGRPAKTVCQWASIRPGISTRPPQSISRAPSSEPVSPLTIFPMRPSCTERRRPPRRAEDLPSNSMKFVNTIGGSGWAAAARARPPRPSAASDPAAPPSTSRRDSSLVIRRSAARSAGWQQRQDGGEARGASSGDVQVNTASLPQGAP